MNLRKHQHELNQVIDRMISGKSQAREIILSRFMELALCRAVPDLTLGTIKPSRLLNLYTRLQKEVDRDLARLPRPSWTDIRHIERRIMEFGKTTGWLNKQRHVGTLLSFCAEMLENSRYAHNPRILETINDIIEHLENGGDLKTICCWAGSVACEKWMEVTK